MSKPPGPLPGNVWWTAEGAYLQRCPACNTENYTLMVSRGICYACGYNANHYPASPYEQGNRPPAEHTH
jgi:hypothetical protein